MLRLFIPALLCLTVIGCHNHDNRTHPIIVVEEVIEVVDDSGDPYDINGDGEVDTTDLELLTCFLFPITCNGDEPDLSDCDGFGPIDLDDLVDFLALAWM